MRWNSTHRVKSVWPHPLGIGVVIIAASFLATIHADAFCRETTCVVSPTPSGCLGTFDNKGCSNEGRPLYWRKPCISYSVHRDGSPKCSIGGDAFERIVRAGFESWSEVNCPKGGQPGFRAKAYPRAECGVVGYSAEGPNRNLWVFRDEDWGYDDGGESAMALTVLTVDARSGEIYDADVELNSRDYAFTTGDAGVGTDLSSIVQHEIGHVLGIGHSEWSTSTMAAGYEAGTVEPRSLEADDRNAICSVFPAEALPAECDYEPREGFSVHCAEPSSGCSLLRRSARASTSAVGCLWALMLLATARPRHSSKGGRQR